MLQSCYSHETVIQNTFNKRCSLKGTSKGWNTDRRMDRVCYRRIEKTLIKYKQMKPRCMTDFEDAPLYDTVFEFCTTILNQAITHDHNYFPPPTSRCITNLLKNLLLVGDDKKTKRRETLKKKAEVNQQMDIFFLWRVTSNQNSFLNHPKLLIWHVLPFLR